MRKLLCCQHEWQWHKLLYVLVAQVKAMRSTTGYAATLALYGMPDLAERAVMAVDGRVKVLVAGWLLHGVRTQKLELVLVLEDEACIRSGGQRDLANKSAQERWSFCMEI